MKRLMFGAAALALALGCGVLLVTHWLARQRAASLTCEILRREPLAFLVTDRVVTRVVVRPPEPDRVKSILLGPEDGVLVATVSLLYGVDLQHLPAEAVRREGGAIRVRVPQPILLSCEVPEKDVFVVSKTTALRKLWDGVGGVDLDKQMRLLVHGEAERFLRENNAVPTRDDLVKRLNGYGSSIEKRVGTPVVFE